VLDSPIAVSVIYTILFSATKQVGAFLFSLSFLIASTVVPKDSVRKSLLISCIGMTILFSSIEITPLNYKVFPPYGVITEAFIPLGAFLLLVGIFTSAVNLSQDGELRRDFRKSAVAQLNLLRTIEIAAQLFIPIIPVFANFSAAVSPAADGNLEIKLST
jgi:hypothetical protein